MYPRYNEKRVGDSRQQLKKMKLTEKKEKIADSFSRYACSYDKYAEAQKISSKQLRNHLLKLKKELPDGPVLEIGCGTGFISKEIVEIFNGRPIQITDISSGMLDYCKTKIKKTGLDCSNVSWEIQDGEAISRNGYALIVSGFTFQWFENLKKSMAKFREAICPGGKIGCSFVGEASFPEWKAMCKKLNIKYTGNPLPSPEYIEKSLCHDSVDVNLFQEDIVLTYTSAMDFFRSIKKIGAGTNIDENALSAKELKFLARSWNEACPDGVKITYKIHYALVEKKYT